MDTIEAGIRRALHAVATEPASGHDTMNDRRGTTELTPVGPQRRHHLVPMVASAASVAIVVGVAFAAGGIMNRPSDTGRPAASATPSPGQPSDSDPVIGRQVEDFVQDVMAKYGETVQPSVDWEAGVITLAVPSPIPPELADLDGTDVSGLTVVVVDAEVSQAEYEAFIVAVGKANFPNKDRVKSFSLLPGGTGVWVNILDLEKLSEADRLALFDNLTALTDATVMLVPASEGAPL